VRSEAGGGAPLVIGATLDLHGSIRIGGAAIMI
jgi:hypothetical protein